MAQEIEANRGGNSGSGDGKLKQTPAWDASLEFSPGGRRRRSPRLASERASKSHVNTCRESFES